MSAPARVVSGWTPALAVGVAMIDEQHQELFRRAAELLAEADLHAQPARLMRTLAFLGDYVVTHFAAEEALMAAHAYPATAVHEAEHAQLVAAFNRIRNQFARAGATASLAEAVQREVCDWLVTHIGSTDRALAAFVRGEG